MSLHKLWAGSGYEYLTRQVARQDAPIRAGSLASYYTERGETPGVWVGSGLAGVEGLGAGDVVTAEQMRSLFGPGLHPLAEGRVAAAREAGAVGKAAAGGCDSGTPFRLRSTAGRAVRCRGDAAAAARAGGTADLLRRPSPARSEMVSEVAAEWFERHHGRAPVDARELAGGGGPVVAAVAATCGGFDLTFSPVKSVSALWAVAPPLSRQRSRSAHRAAVEDALRFVEQQALFSREGARGVRQVEVTGLVATAFTHRDSRAGDPDLHTHVAVANKVQTRQGKWLAIDGRVLYGGNGRRVGDVQHRAGTSPAGTTRTPLRCETCPGWQRREVRELVGVDPRLLVAWSSRRQAIDVRRGELARSLPTADRPPSDPSRKRGHWLSRPRSRRATGKHEPRTLDEQRASWASQAADVLGGSRQVAAMVSRTLEPRPAAVAERVDAAWVARTAAEVTAVMESERAVWGPFHLQAEAQRQIRGAGHDPGLAPHLVDLVVAEAANQAVRLAGPLGVPEPPVLRRSDGVSVYEVAGSARWTSSRVIVAEKRSSGPRRTTRWSTRRPGAQCRSP